MRDLGRFAVFEDVYGSPASLERAYQIVIDATAEEQVTTELWQVAVSE